MFISTAQKKQKAMSDEQNSFNLTNNWNVCVVPKDKSSEEESDAGDKDQKAKDKDTEMKGEDKKAQDKDAKAKEHLLVLKCNYGRAF